jgi:tetratricopeptide (TPR) repeat protein
MSWNLIAERHDQAANAAFHNHFEVALDIYHSTLSDRSFNDRDQRHFLFRQLALGYIALDAPIEARSSFNSAFELSKTDTDFAKVFYDRGLSLIDRGLFAEAIEDFRAARQAYGLPPDNDKSEAVLRLIEDRIQECEVSLASTRDKPGTGNLTTKDSGDWPVPVANRPGESTSEILASWGERSSAHTPKSDR